MGYTAGCWSFSCLLAAGRRLLTTASSPPHHQGRGGAGFVATPGALWVVAGFCGEESNDVHRFDLASETWDCPRCCGPEAAAAAPAAGAGSCGHGNVVVLPPRSVCAVATHGCSSCAHSNHVVVFGGEVDPSSECV